MYKINNKVNPSWLFTVLDDSGKGEWAFPSWIHPRPDQPAHMLHMLEAEGIGEDLYTNEEYKCPKCSASVPDVYLNLWKVLCNTKTRLAPPI